MLWIMLTLRNAIFISWLIYSCDWLNLIDSMGYVHLKKRCLVTYSYKKILQISQSNSIKSHVLDCKITSLTLKVTITLNRSCRKSAMQWIVWHMALYTNYVSQNLFKKCAFYFKKSAILGLFRPLKEIAKLHHLLLRWQ